MMILCIISVLKEHATQLALTPLKHEIFHGIANMSINVFVRMNNTNLHDRVAPRYV